MQRALVMRLYRSASIASDGHRAPLGRTCMDRDLGEAKQRPNALFPELVPLDESLTAARAYMRTTSANVTSTSALQLKRKAKGKAIAFDADKPKKLTVFVSRDFPAWQDQYVQLVRSC